MAFSELGRGKIIKSKIPEIFKEKWKLDLLDEGFLPFPKRLIRGLPRLLSDKLTIDQFCLMLALVDYQRPNLSRYPSLEYLSSVTAFKEDKVKLLFQELADKQLLAFSEDDNEMNYDLSPFYSLASKCVKEAG